MNNEQLQYIVNVLNTVMGMHNDEATQVLLSDCICKIQQMIAPNTDPNINKIQLLVDAAIERIDSMSIDELEHEFKSFGLDAIRR